MRVLNDFFSHEKRSSKSGRRIFLDLYFEFTLLFFQLVFKNIYLLFHRNSDWCLIKVDNLSVGIKTAIEATENRKIFNLSQNVHFKDEN